MPFWADALIFIAVAAGIGLATDFFARRRRSGLIRYGTPVDTGDPIGNVERIMPGTSSQAAQPTQIPHI